jgi:hypothetical protein
MNYDWGKALGCFIPFVLFSYCLGWKEREGRDFLFPPWVFLFCFRLPHFLRVVGRHEACLQRNDCGFLSVEIFLNIFASSISVAFFFFFALDDTCIN